MRELMKAALLVFSAYMFIGLFFAACVFLASLVLTLDPLRVKAAIFALTVTMSVVGLAKAALFLGRARRAKKSRRTPQAQ